jgi:DNA-binding HxlR family transcriptional regulator
MNKNKNRDSESKARTSILNVLSDGKWHQTKDLKVETHVSSKTLYKNLKTLEKFIEKRIDKNGKYPYPVYYRANPALMSIFYQVDMTNLMWKTTVAVFLESKDPLLALDFVNETTKITILTAFSNFKKRNIDVSDPEIVRLFLRAFVWETYETITWNFTKAYLKIMDEIDLEKLAKNLKAVGSHGSS